MNEVEVWAVTFVTNLDSSFDSLTDDEKLRENLFTSGRLDSMALMDLLLDLETNFGFTFTAEAFQDRRIHTITGLSEVVAEFLVKV